MRSIRATVRRLAGTAVLVATAIFVPTVLPSVAVAAGAPLVTTNWGAGYFLQGGPFSTVNASFTVTSANSGWSSDGYVSEFVWLGHFSQGGFTNFVAVGVNLQMTPCEGGSATPGQFYTCGFTYTYPGTNQGGGMPLLQVEANDGMSATIETAPGVGNYTLELSDDTVAAQCGQDCSPGAAMTTSTVHASGVQPNEIGWFVEAGGKTFTGFAPAVQFSNETYSGSAQQTTEVSQDTKSYSVTPSALDNSGNFTVSSGAPVAAPSYHLPVYAKTAKIWWDTDGKKDTDTLVLDLGNLNQKLSPAALGRDCKTMSNDEVHAMLDLQPPKTDNLSGIWYGFLLDVATTANWCSQAAQNGETGNAFKEARQTYGDTVTYLNHKLMPALQTARLIKE